MALPIASRTVAAPASDSRWRALRARDASADGTFVFAVRTTGVYCRPSCRARAALARNIVFFPDGAAAVAAGFRPCRRCQPDQAGPRPHAAWIVAACRRIERATDRAEAAPTLAALAAAAGLSPSHFQRRFQAATGLSPKAYATAHRARRLRAQLADRTASVTDAIYAAGFNAPSRFYSAASARLGMTPSVWRRGGEGVEIRFALGQSTLGALLVACSPRGVCAIALGDDPESLVRDLQDQFPRARLLGADRAFEQTVARVVGWVEAGAAKSSTGDALPLDVHGTAFQERVWRALRRIPPGRTLTYAALARRLGQPSAARAVAGACAANPVALAIPCHRVVRTDGAPSGYRWGISRKQTLLARERAAAR